MDYSLNRPNDEIIAMVEAKRMMHDPCLTQQQAEHFVAAIAKHQNLTLFAFPANSVDIYFHDIGNAPKYWVAGFFSPDDLEYLLFIRQNKPPLVQALINAVITDRAYQHEAMRRISLRQLGKHAAIVSNNSYPHFPI